MKSLLLNIVLALTWCAASGAVNVTNLVVGFLVGYAVLSVHPEITRNQNYRKKVYHFVSFVAYFGWEVIVGAIDVALATVWPFRRVRPGVVAVPLDTRSAAERTILANAVTLTPGTMSIDLTADGKTLYVHVIDAKDPEAVRRAIKRGLEARLIRLFE
ncbi:MAG: Na+/H+ antiporter subunit E [Candidatus Hydrogenedentes bacterium]|nr:Na+/H+ antiporter subunit E [Candidatus Hydrogenedentota bacterium]